MFYHAGHVFKLNTIYLFLLPAVGWIRDREEKRREEKGTAPPIIMYFSQKMFSPLSFSFVPANKTPAIIPIPMAKNPDGFPC